ncbi:hypothetical protein AGMMS50276_27180 [Synergistales bacterium]|nr:hypothetical protein AGMMS50276_27180 [Synergistales bacterium]
MRKFIYGILIMAVVLTFVFPAFAAGTNEVFCVTDELLPVMDEPGGSYDIDDLYSAEGLMIIVVYGNHVNTRPVAGKFEDAWVELLDPEDGSSLGFIEKKGLEALPKQETFETAKFFIVGKDAPDLLLSPGKAGKKYSLSEYGYSLTKGEVVTAFGESVLNKTRWLLLGFSTSTEYDGNEGVGARYAWIRADDLTPLPDYAPDSSKIDAAWAPSRTRAAVRTIYDEEKEESFTTPPFAPIEGALFERILRQGFWIDPAPVIPDQLTADDMADLYNSTGEYETDFVTVDLFLHATHLIFDRMLQKFERTFFAPTLEKSMATALAELEKVKSGLDAATYETARDMFSVPLALLKKDASLKLSERALAEVKKILSAQGLSESEIGGAMTDYTQYLPRGHYTLTPELERYFRAMTFLGTCGLELFEADGNPRLENVRVATLVTLVLDNLGGTWRSFEEPIEFLIGNPDDGGLKAYRDIVKKNIGNIEGLGDEVKLGQLAAAVKTAVPSPRIRDRATGNISKEEEDATRRPEFRISGKRFTFDAYVLNQLTSPRVGTNETPRNLPEGTDAMAVLGSRAADEIAGRNEGVLHYADNLKALKEEAVKFFASEGAFYTLWLDALRSFFRDSGSKQFFYNSAPWQWKKLLTASAAWAEMKHDTLLYAKQGGAEMGGLDLTAGKFAPPAPRGYVEPDPQAFGVIIAALDRLSEFIEKFSMEADSEPEYIGKIQQFRELCATAKTIAEKQVAEAPLTLEDYESIKTIARSFGAQLLLPGGWEIEWDKWEELRMALVADAATDFVAGRALYVAIGTPRKIYVYVNDKMGGPRIARGYVYSYYEFARSLEEGRLTDEEWRTIVYDEARDDELKKLHPAWYGELDAK